MKINFFATSSPLFRSAIFEDSKPISVFCGTSIFLNLMRSLLDGEEETSIESTKGQIFIGRVNLKLEDKIYDLWGVLKKDQSFIVTAHREDGFSDARSKKCISKLRALSSDAKNLFCLENKYVNNDHCLSESDYIIANFKKFLEIVKEETEKGDSRPIYVFNLFERIDEAVDVTPFLDELASLGRQVFVSVTANYPTEKLAHNSVQIFEQNI